MSWKMFTVYVILMTLYCFLGIVWALFCHKWWNYSSKIQISSFHNLALDMMLISLDEAFMGNI